MEKSFNPIVGKTVLETLTTGMYDDARFVFREYVQNAADQIDEAVEEGILSEKSEGKIEITIDVPNRRITISDNATGVKNKDVAKLLGDVANSTKDSKTKKGFRGIGRLGGLGYCERLLFETSYINEGIKSTMVLNAKLLKDIIKNREDNSDATAAMSMIATEQPPVKEDSSKHYFRVILENVKDNLLNIESVKEYLSMVAPVPFSAQFSFTKEIKTFLKSRNLVLDEYNVEINSETLYKGYKNYFTDEKGNFSNLIGVDFVDIRNDLQELLACGWYGYREHSNIVLDVSNIERGLRIRTKNIAIGNEFTCNRFFDQERTNLRFIGEIHTLSQGFIPNARRDYFTENNTFEQFEKNIKEIFKQENLENRLAQTASKLHNRLKEILKYKEVYENFEKNKGSFDNASTENFHLTRLKELEVKAQKAKLEIEKINNKSDSSEKVKILYNSIIKDNDLAIEHLKGNDLEVSQYAPPTFKKLNEEQKRIVIDIFDILEEELDFDLSELIKKRIVEKFN